ncbi:hypothetical protein V6N11_045841 [Hibiscus sabdariffa]|uniref:Uncharacterized protein n=1 Tax=Hibiscus sabdariffa TaxID=183260 RepID=A0ABR2Q252_9ROSI
MDPSPQKINLISCELIAHVSDIKLIRTDTTLDLSQKAEKGNVFSDLVVVALLPETKGPRQLKPENRTRAMKFQSRENTPIMELMPVAMLRLHPFVPVGFRIGSDRSRTNTATKDCNQVP